MPPKNDLFRRWAIPASFTSGLICAPSMAPPASLVDSAQDFGVLGVDRRQHRGDTLSRGLGVWPGGSITGPGARPDARRKPG
jgi:hypothetical protein